MARHKHTLAHTTSLIQPQIQNSRHNGRKRGATRRQQLFEFGDDGDEDDDDDDEGDRKYLRGWVPRYLGIRVSFSRFKWANRQSQHLNSSPGFPVPPIPINQPVHFSQLLGLPNP